MKYGPACGPYFTKSAKISGQVRTGQDVELPIAESDGIVEE